MAFTNNYPKVVFFDSSINDVIGSATPNRVIGQVID